MTRIAIVTTEPTASRVPQLDLLARRDGIDLTVFYAASSVQGRTWSLTLDHPHEILRGPAIPLTRVLHHDYPVTPSLWRKLNHGDFDCLVIWGWSTFASQLAIAWCRTHRVPYVLFAESHFGEQRRMWVRALKRLVVPFVVRGAATWLVTGTLAREHLVHYGADPARTWTFANTVDVAALGGRADELRPRRSQIRKRFGFTNDDVVVLHAGRLLPVKGVDVLIEAAALARGVKLLIVGDGPRRSALEREAASVGIDATFAGFLAGDQLVEAYVAADIFALLSRRETWGVVVNEAAAWAFRSSLRAVSARPPTSSSQARTASWWRPRAPRKPRRCSDGLPKTWSFELASGPNLVTARRPGITSLSIESFVSAVTAAISC